MFLRILLSLGLLTLAACTTSRVALLPDATIWEDKAFEYRSTRITENRETVFALDESVLQSLRATERHGYTAEKRLDQLLTQVYSQHGVHPTYASGHTTGATQTWNEKRGDCLSLTILVYSAARALGLAPQMQEVSVPVTIDRRHGVDFVSGHVNVFIRNHSEISIEGRTLRPGGVVIDFDPQPGSHQIGLRLTEEEILARYYNNRASEYLSRRDQENAYAYYRAAIGADPRFGPAFANLAQLYQQRGMDQSAERLLLHAIELQGHSYASLRAMHRLLQSQGRTDEADHYAALLKRRQDEDPYYWLGVGRDAMQGGRVESAITALERGLSMAFGFEELHQDLAVAYWRNGQREAAHNQLALLEAMNSQDAGLAILSRKIRDSKTPK